MNLANGPIKLEKLKPGCKVVDFEVSTVDSLLLISSTENRLESCYLKHSPHGGLVTKLLPVKSFNVDWKPQMFCFSGKQNIVYTNQQNLVINNKHEIKHKNKINHLTVDDMQVALTTSKDIITLTSITKTEQLAELHQYTNNISSIFWHNSLIISGDERGTLNLWDINKKKIIHSNSVFASKIDYINSYADFIHTNLYYSISKTQKRIAFHDLRTYQPIKINNHLPIDLVKIQHNASGKIFLMTKHNIEIIDLYQGYDSIGRFSQISKQQIDDFKLKYPQSNPCNRTLNDILILGKYVIVGNSTGCIQVYDSDTFECLYAYGMCEFSGIQKLHKLDNSILALESKGILSIAQFL